MNIMTKQCKKIFLVFCIVNLFLINGFVLAANKDSEKGAPGINVFEKGNDITGIIKSLDSGVITLTDGQKFYVNNSTVIVKMDGKQVPFSSKAILSLGMVKLVINQIGENFIVTKIIEIAGL